MIPNIVTGTVKEDVVSELKSDDSVTKLSVTLLQGWPGFNVVLRYVISQELFQSIKSVHKAYNPMYSNNKNLFLQWS